MRRILILALAVLGSWISVPARGQPSTTCESSKLGRTLDTAEDLKVLDTTVYRFHQCVDASANPDHYYRFVLPAPTGLNVIVAGTGSPFVIELLDGNGVRLGRARGRNKSSADIGKLLAAGTYYVRVTGSSGVTPYTAEFHPSLQVVDEALAAGTSVGWQNIAPVYVPLVRVDFQIVKPANAGSYWVVDGNVRKVDANPWSVTDHQYKYLRYVAGAVGSVEVVFYRFVFVDGGEKEWRAIRFRSTP